MLEGDRTSVRDAVHEDAGSHARMRAILFLTAVAAAPLAAAAAVVSLLARGRPEWLLPAVWGSAAAALIVFVALALLLARWITRPYLRELQASRNELRRGVEWLGAALRSSLDLGGMLGVVLETTMSTLRARAGVVYLLTPSGRELRPEVIRGLEAPPDPLRVGDGGIAGTAAGGRPVLLPSRLESIEPAPGEPAVATALAVPLVRGRRVMGVLALYGRAGPEAFSEDEGATLASLAAQASVALENVLLHEQAKRQSITDGLTGLWNRRYLNLVLRKEIERAERFRRPLSMLLLDIDHFKRVNDDHGHLAGDEVLVELSRRVMGCIRSQVDTLVRYGGEEFLVLLPETPCDGARVVAEKIRGVVSGEPVATRGGGAIPVTVSLGTACFPQDGRSPQELIAAADAALYRAKARGRDRVEASGS